MARGKVSGPSSAHYQMLVEDERHSVDSYN